MSETSQQLLLHEKHAKTKTKTKTKTKGEIFVKSETDRISELPDDILSSFLSYFTVRDAANASVLSSRWRHLCASISVLDFDLDSMFRSHKDCNIKRRRSMDICRPYKDIFVRGVNQFLQSYQGTRLVSFRVSFCLEKDSANDVDQWVSFAIRMGVESLILNLSCCNCYTYDKRSRGRDLYTLRSELLAQGNMAKLHTLFLRSCIMGPGIINQFSSLKSLLLAHVPLGPHEVESIGSCCLSLESIYIADCTLPLKFCISGSLHRLKFLAVCNCSGVEMIQLSATNLTSFDYGGSFVTFSFSGVPNLKRIFLSVDGKKVQYVFGQLAKDLPLVETLLLFPPTKWVQFLPEYITTFSKLKELELFSTRQTKFDILKIIAILKACPLVEKLHLVVCVVYTDEQGMQRLPMPLESESCHKYLKEVRIGGFRFNASYIEVAIYMLEYAVTLERMIIDPKLRFYMGGDSWWSHNKRVTWEKGERAKVCLCLQDHPKSSMIIII